MINMAIARCSVVIFNFDGADCAKGSRKSAHHLVFDAMKLLFLEFRGGIRCIARIPTTAVLNMASSSRWCAGQLAHARSAHVSASEMTNRRK